MSVWNSTTEEYVHTLDKDTKTLRLTVVLPSYYMFLPDQHHHLHVTSSEESVISVPPFDIPDLTFDWELPVEVLAEGEAMLHLEGQVFFCPVSDATICIYATVDHHFHVRVERGSGHGLEIVHEIDILDTLDVARTTRVTPTGVADEK